MNTSNTTILYIDKNEISRGSVRRLLGYELPEARLLEANNIDTAIEFLKGHPVSLIICDDGPPELFGIQWLKSLRSEGNNIPFILQTGKNNAGFKREVESFTNAYSLLRDVSPEEFLKYIAKALGPTSSLQEIPKASGSPFPPP